MDSSFGFLDSSALVLLRDIVSRRQTDLYMRLQNIDSLAQTDADAIVNALGEELANNLDADWEPTEYGLTVSALLARFNAVRIAEWP